LREETDQIFSKMAKRYDSRTTTFSPEGRLFQVEYAMEAISQAGTAVGIKTRSGITIAAERRILSKLLESSEKEKTYYINEHIAVAVAGIRSDANILVNYARVVSQRHLFTYGEPIPVEQLVQAVCDQKQGYTQFGGLRPYGVSFLIGGWLVFIFKRHFQSAKLLSLGTKSLDFNCIKVTPWQLHSMEGEPLINQRRMRDNYIFILPY